MYYAFSSLLAVALAWVTVINPGLDRFVTALETISQVVQGATS